MLPGLDPFLRRGAAMQEPMALVARLHDVAVVRETVEQGGRHLCVPEHRRSLSEVQVGCDHHAGVLVEPGQGFNFSPSVEPAAYTTCLNQHCVLLRELNFVDSANLEELDAGLFTGLTRNFL